MGQATPQKQTFTAWAGHERIARGDVEAVVLAVRDRAAVDRTSRLAVFFDATGLRVDFDLQGEPAEVLARLPGHPVDVVRQAAGREEPDEADAQPDGDTPPTAGTAPRRGRPRLGVVAREVTLLPRHWTWLSAQRGGASAALRRLVDEARQRDQRQVQTQQRVQAIHAFLWDLAGDLPGFEAASRALFAGDLDRVHVMAASWPGDLAQHVRDLSAEL